MMTVIMDDSWMDDVPEDFQNYEDYLMRDIEYMEMMLEYEAARGVLDTEDDND